MKPPGASGRTLRTPGSGTRSSATVCPADGRGEVFLVDLEPVRGSEANKQRPAIIVSNDGANSAASRLGSGVVTVVPVTSNVRRVLPFQVLLPRGAAGLDRASKAQAEQVRSVAVERIRRSIGQLPVTVMAEVDEALRLHLAL